MMMTLPAVTLPPGAYLETAAGRIDAVLASVYPQREYEEVGSPTPVRILIRYGWRGRVLAQKALGDEEGMRLLEDPAVFVDSSGRRWPVLVRSVTAHPTTEELTIDFDGAGDPEPETLRAAMVFDEAQPAETHKCELCREWKPCNWRERPHLGGRWVCAECG